MTEAMYFPGIPPEIRLKEGGYKLLGIGIERQRQTRENGDEIGSIKERLGRPVKKQMTVLARRKAILDKEIEKAQAKGQKPDEAKLKEQGTIKEKLGELENSLKNVGAGNRRIKRLTAQNNQLNKQNHALGSGLSSNLHSGDIADFLNRYIAEDDKFTKDRESSASSFVFSRGSGLIAGITGSGQ